VKSVRRKTEEKNLRNSTSRLFHGELGLEAVAAISSNGLRLLEVRGPRSREYIARLEATVEREECPKDGNGCQ